MSNFVQISPKILEPRLPELGHIKIGGKGQERKAQGSNKKFRLPVKFDHFVLTKRTRDPQTDNLVRDEAIHARIGAKPTELDVRLLFDRPEQNFQYFLAAYDGKRLRCKGNGETAMDREHGSIPCACPWFKGHDAPYAGPTRPPYEEYLEDGKKKRRPAPTCKPHGRLSVIVEAAESFGGFYVFRTTSWETIRSIAAQLDTYLQQFGFLAGLPLRMVLYPATDTYEEKGQTKTSTSYKVALVVRASFDTARQLAGEAYERRNQLALPSPKQAEVHQRQLAEEEERDAAHIAAEFHPETVIGDDAPDFMVVDDEEESDAEEEYLEALCRMTLEAADWEPDRINRQIAKYSADLAGLKEQLAEKMPKQLEQAEAFLSSDGSGEDGEREAEGVEESEAEAPVEAAAAAQSDLF